MKKLGKILCLSIAIIIISTSFSFASGLTLIRSFPEEGKSNLNPQNIAVKLAFSEKISDPATIKANARNFKITNSEGQAIDFEPLYNEIKYPNEVWLQISNVLDQNSTYKVTVLEGMQGSSGSTLDKSIVLNFATRNTEADSKGYMFLMMIMIGGMVVFSIFDSKRKMKKETAREEQKVNPYKEAKRTGKSVEAVVAKTERKKAQVERRKEKAAQRQGPAEDSDEESIRPGVKRVKKPRPISEKGYSTPQSFIDERLARERANAEKERQAQRQQARSKGSKQQQRKKKK